MKTSIILILKNKNGDTSTKNNYRPIVIVTAMSKIFELCLSRIMDAYLFTSDNQFGFKWKHSTDLCIYTVHLVHDLYYIKIKCINNLWCNDTNKLKEVHLNYLLVSRSYYTQIQLLKLMKQLQDINIQCHK